MIRDICFERDWIDGFRKQKRFGKINSPLLEKMIHALYLVQNLKKQGLDFVFKGGTSLILLLENANRFSVDVDVVINKKYEAESTRMELAVILDEIVNGSRFTGWMLDERRSYTDGVPKAHYKLEYVPVHDRSGYILLDVLFEKNYYPNIIEVPIEAVWIKSDEAVSVALPDVDSIVGDKLTAFAPNTTGIRYGTGKELEIIKQLFDIGNLFEKIESLETVSKSFEAFAKEEIGYRDLSIDSRDVLNDIAETAKIIARRDKNTVEPSKSNFAQLQRGIKSFAPFLISGHFRLDDAIAASAKAAYLAAKLLTKNYEELERYRGASVSGLNIDNQEWNFLNKLKKLPDKSAFYYWYHTDQLLGN